MIKKKAGLSPLKEDPWSERAMLQKQAVSPQGSPIPLIPAAKDSHLYHRSDGQAATGSSMPNVSGSANDTEMRMMNEEEPVHPVSEMHSLVAA